MTTIKEIFASLQFNNYLTQKDAQILMGFVINQTKDFVKINPDFELNNTQTINFNEIANQRFNGKPIAKIIGLKDFWKGTFYTNEHTLDPRPDSETLIEHVLEIVTNKNENYTILDLGTGTGCLAISLLEEYKNATATLVDSSINALNVANKNIIQHNVGNRAECVRSNWLDSINGNFDIIISNPPYISKNDIDKLDIQVSFDPPQALFAEENGLLCYKIIANNLAKVLKENSVIFFEIGLGQENDVENIMSNCGFKLVSNKKDLAGIIRTCAFTKEV